MGERRLCLRFPLLTNGPDISNHAGPVKVSCGPAVHALCVGKVNKMPGLQRFFW
jgi:hypothetical protein